MLNTLFASLLLVGLSNCKKSEMMSVKESDAAVTSSMAGNGAAQNPKHYEAHIEALNNSGVSGTAMLTLDGEMLTVEITATGLEPHKTHAQHIHGFTENNKNASCPGMKADTDGDGLISIGEGLPFYGPVLIALTPFQTPGADGMIHYMQTFDLSGGNTVSPLQTRAIVLHGLTVNGTYIGSLPVGCAQIKSANGNGQ